MTNRTTWQPPASSTTQSTAPTRAAWLGKIIWWLANNAVNVLSAEFLLKLGRPNGGTLILIRSAWISITLYGVALALQSGTYARWTWELWNWRFSLAQLSKDIGNTVHWLGAIFAAVYVALYARFAAQFSYLQGVYNQIMAVEASAPPNEWKDETIATWSAGFVEDAIELHLATKPVFSITVWIMLNQPGVYDNFIRYTKKGPRRLARLVRHLRRSLGDETLLKMVPTDDLFWNRRPTLEGFIAHPIGAAAYIPR